MVGFGTMAIDEKGKIPLLPLARMVGAINGKSVWRGSLEDPFTGERMGLVNLRELFIYLTTQIGENEQDNDEMSE